MTKTIDGCSIDIPPTLSQIIALAQLHRKQLDEVISHDEIRLGDFCLQQKSKIANLVNEFDQKDQAEFYRVYNGELIRLSSDLNTHEHEYSSPTAIKASIAIICVAAIVLGLTFLSRIF